MRMCESWRAVSRLGGECEERARSGDVADTHGEGPLHVEDGAVVCGRGPDHVWVLALAVGVAGADDVGTAAVVGGLGGCGRSLLLHGV